MIISTGMANLDEIETTVKIAKRNGANDITLLYCVSNYPSSLEDFNLNNVKILKNKFKCKVGISDHSNDNRVAIVGIASGAEIIEKHIALENQKKGFDIIISNPPYIFSRSSNSGNISRQFSFLILSSLSVISYQSFIK